MAVQKPHSTEKTKVYKLFTGTAQWPKKPYDRAMHEIFMSIRSGSMVECNLFFNSYRLLEIGCV